MSRAVLSADGLSLSPALPRRLAPDYLDRAEQIGDPNTDFALPQRLLDLQRAVLNFLMSDGLAARVLDSAQKVDKPAEAFQLTELYRRLFDDVWGEIEVGKGAGKASDKASNKSPHGSISPARRELQRSYVNRLSAALVRPSPVARADARGLMRLQARQLLAKLEAASTSAIRGADADTRVHLSDSVDTLRQALQANVQRLGL